MIGALARKFFGSANDRRIKGYQARVEAINALESELVALKDDELSARTAEFRQQLAGGKTLDDILVPAFATVREAAKRTLQQRHFDVQLIGGMVLHEGDIAEMKTGEGKTLVATLAVYLNALAGRGVHVITVNDYLAQRDSDWMGQIYKFLGLSVGVIVHGRDDTQRRAAYACDVTYGTNNEFGFDYLRDNMKMGLHEMVQFGFRLFPGTIYQEISQARTDLNDQAMRAVEKGNPIDFGAQGERAGQMSGKALALAAEVLSDLIRQLQEAPEANRSLWTARKESLERLRDRIVEQQELIRSGMESRDWDKVRNAVDRIFRLTASLAVELQTAAQRHATEANAAVVGNEAVDLTDAALDDLRKRQANGSADDGRSASEKKLEALADQLKEPVAQLDDRAAPELRRDAVEVTAQLAQSVAAQILGTEEPDKKLRERAEELATQTALLSGGKDAAAATLGGHFFAIVDEVDSILIDEARTPLIISGPLDDRSEFYNTIDTFLPKLDKVTDFEVDEKQRTVTLTEAGMEKIEVLLRDAGQLKGDSLYDVENVSVVHHINQALRAHSLFQRDKDYIVRDDEVIIIDEFTGRMMQGRRYSEGLHQALEAKEHVQVQPENQTLASITFQNYFRMYEKLAGMTGTALTEADELFDIYKLEVVEIPTNVPVERDDEDDEVYRTQSEKYAAILAEVERANARLQPVLVGTASIEKSEVLAEYLKKHGYKQIDFGNENAMEKLYAAARAGKPAKLFAVLNARFHEQEAYIVAEAGVPGAITIATNMAGRGTDIKLGGSLEMRIQHETAGITDEAEKAAKIERIKADVERFRNIVLNADDVIEIEPAKGSRPAKTVTRPGGLYIIGSERHESRRIDNQLRGRSGRQGDPGRSKFFLSLEDDLMRIFGSDRLDTMLTRLGLKEGEAIIHPWINKALEKAQQKVEARNFDIRKNLLKFDNVQNDQRKAIFDQRVDLMREDSVAETVADMRRAFVEDVVTKHVPEHAYAEQWHVAELKEELNRVLGIDLPVDQWAKEEGIADEELLSRIDKHVDEHMAAKVAQWGSDIMRYVEKMVLLQTLDRLWREHLVMLDHLRQVIGLRGYGQRDPLQEYKSEAFSLFEAMIAHLREEVTAQLMRVEIIPPEEQQPVLPPMEAHKLDPNTGEDEMAFANASLVPTPTANRDPKNPASWGKVGRNEDCPCGSGKKYKHCHGKLA